MFKNKRKLPLWLILGMVSLVVLTACTAALSGSAVVADIPFDEFKGATEDLIDESIPEIVESETETSISERRNDVELLTIDDRPDRLRQLTRNWNTNWNLHTVEYSELLSGGPPRDGIQSIDDPKFIDPDQASAWLADNEPVIFLELNGDARAYPLQIITWHEIINDVVGGVPAVVTFCPLCNSALAFNSTVDGQVFEFGVSGLLRNSDLIMYDRTTETLWQQFTGEGIIGDLAGTRLEFLPTSIISFSDFRTAHPEGQVLSRDTGLRGNYGNNPYAGYDTYQHVLSAGGNLALFNGDVDVRLAAADRVVTVSLDDIGIDIAYPVTLLSEVGVINDSQGDQDLVVFFTPGTASALGASVISQAEDVGATGVFDPNLNGEKLTFQLEGDKIVDEQTGSSWNIVGQAVEGPLAGQELEPIVHGDHFWFSWAAFKPDTIIYQTPS
jgi:hypothetical protein